MTEIPCDGDPVHCQCPPGQVPIPPPRYGICEVPAPPTPREPPVADCLPGFTHPPSRPDVCVPIIQQAMVPVIEFGGYGFCALILLVAAIGLLMGKFR
jgi:hypothetical protein